MSVGEAVPSVMSTTDPPPSPMERITELVVILLLVPHDDSSGKQNERWLLGCKLGSPTRCWQAAVLENRAAFAPRHATQTTRHAATNIHLDGI
eukprot:287124-Prymnesium_polylepis.1